MFGGIVVVAVWQDQLEVIVFCLHEVHEHSGSLIVHVLEFGSWSCFAKALMSLLIGSKDGLGLSVFEWDGKDGIAIIVI